MKRLHKSGAVYLTVAGVIVLIAGAVVWSMLANGGTAPPATSLDAALEKLPEIELDRYGGVPVRVADGAGFFRVAKVANRWVFVTPEGNAFWMLGVFNVDMSGSTDDQGDSYKKRVARKYGTTQIWAEQTARRLKRWGFNSLAEYTSSYLLPTKSPYGGRWSNPIKMPFIKLIRPSFYGLKNQAGFATGPFKDLIAGVDPLIYKGWRGASAPDVFDQRFEDYVAGWLQQDTELRVAIGSPWLLGIATDDADDLYGFGPGPELPTTRLRPHIAWFVLVGSFQQTKNEKLGLTYADPKVYSKYALRDFLQNKYGNIERLNAAWGSKYTTFDSNGGWPSGKGLLDESGRSPWVGVDSERLSKATVGVRSDLDEFLYMYAKHYFSVVARHIRRYAPNHLVFGPATLNGGGLTRKEILRAAGEFLDVLQASPRTKDLLELTAKYAGDIPIVTWEGVVANKDSGLWRYPNPEGLKSAVSSQKERADFYRDRIFHAWNARTSSEIQPIAGIKLWAFVDSWGEKSNWGLVTLSDNAYDGKEATVAPGKDAWGYSTGGEERDYGDFISTIREAHNAVYHRLREEMQNARSHQKERKTSALR